MDSPQQTAKAIHDGALRAVVDRISELGADFHPAAVPLVAANVAMSAMALSLMAVDPDQRFRVLGELRDSAGPAAIAASQEVTLQLHPPAPARIAGDYGWEGGQP